MISRDELSVFCVFIRRRVSSSNHQVIKSSSHQVIKSSSHQVIKSSNHQVIKSMHFEVLTKLQKNPWGFTAMFLGFLKSRSGALSAGRALASFSDDKSGNYKVEIINWIFYWIITRNWLYGSASTTAHTESLRLKNLLIF